MAHDALIDALKRLFAEHREGLLASITDEDLILLTMQAIAQAKAYHLLKEMLPDNLTEEKDEAP